MLPDHLSQALLACPFGKSECLLIDGCSVIKLYEYDHRGLQSPNEWQTAVSDAMKAKASLGGKNMHAKKRGEMV